MNRKKWLLAALAVWCGVSLAAGEAVNAGEPEEKIEQQEEVLGENDAEKIYLGIDTVHVYETMSSSFSQGYIPVIEGDTVHLAVPFTASGELKNHQLTVGLDLGTDGPFVYANYQKIVEKKVYTFDEAQTETYLYLCDIGLDQERMNGKYPVTVKAAGYTEQGKKAELEYRIFITVTDGKNPSEAADKNQDKDQQENEGTDGGDQDKGNQNNASQGGSNQGAENLIRHEESESGDEKGLGDTSGEGESFGGMSARGDSFGGTFAGGGSGEEVVHQPKIILESNNLSGVRSKAGETKDFVLSFKNRSRNEKICNLKVTAKAAEDTVTLQDSSFYYDSVAPQETIELSTVAVISPVAEQKNIPVEITFEYENDKGTAYMGTEQASISVYQPVNAVVEGINLPAIVYSLENVNVNMQIRNVGKAPVYNVQVQLEGAGLFPMETAFAGNMEAGESIDAGMRIYVGNKNMTEAGQGEEGGDEEKYGSVTGKLILTYEDAFGEVYSQEQEFVTVIQKPQLTELKVEKEKKETNQWWAVVFVLVILLFSGLTGVMGWKLRKSRNRVADFLAEQEGKHVT